MTIRPLTLAAIRDGASHTDAARVGGMDRQTLRDWVHCFNAEGPDDLRDYQHPAASSGAGSCRHGGIQKKLPRILSGHTGPLPKGKPIEIWFQDEARIGQKNGTVRQWARRGSGHASRLTSVTTKPGRSGQSVRRAARATGLALPFIGTASMQLHIEEISRCVARGVHAVVLLDRAGWHITDRLKLPRNVSLIFLPSRAPELNPVENIWQFLRASWLSNTVFDGIEHIIDAACGVWHNLAALPDTIRSIGLRKWAYTGQSL